MGSLITKRWAQIREAGAVNVADDIDDPTAVSPAVREGDDAPPPEQVDVPGVPQAVPGDAVSQPNVTEPSAEPLAEPPEPPAVGRPSTGAAARANRGRRTPYVPRRPTRHAARLAEKARRKMEAAVQQEEVPQEDVPPNEDDVAVRGMAIALASAAPQLPPRRRCRDSVDILVEEARGFEPQHLRRRMLPLHAPLMSGEEVPGARLQYRLGQEIELEYGQYATDNYASETLLVTSNFIDNIQKCRTYCHKCNSRIKYDIVGIGNARTFTGYCGNNRCNFESTLRHDNKKLGYFYVQNLLQVLHAITYDTGYVGYEAMCHFMRQKKLSRDSFWNHIYFCIDLWMNFMTLTNPRSTRT